MKIVILICLLVLDAGSVSGQSMGTKPEPTAGVDVEASYKALKTRKDYIYKYDRFKDKTVLTSKPHDLMTTGEHMAVGMIQGLGAPHPGPADAFPAFFSLGIGFGFDGKTLSGEPRFGIYFLSSSPSWAFLKDHHLYALIDGDRLDLGNGDHDGDVYFTGVTEQMTFDLTREQFAKFAHGKSVEIQLGGFERKLKPERMKEFSELLEIVPEAKE